MTVEPECKTFAVWMELLSYVTITSRHIESTDFSAIDRYVAQSVNDFINICKGVHRGCSYTAGHLCEIS